MNPQVLESACTPEVFDYEGSVVSQGGTENQAACQIPFARKDTDSLHRKTQPQYVIQSRGAANGSTPRWELLNAVTQTPANSLRDAPTGIPERGLPRPHMSGSPILDLSEAQHEQNSGVTQVADRRKRARLGLSPEQQELRRPPSPFLLLDADHTRPDLPTNARIVHAISVSRIE